MITLDAGQLARGWLAVNQATGKDDSATNPAMRKTVHVDQFPQGLRLVATDSYMLLTSWIPQADGYEPEPSLDEIPYASATVIDKHNRAVSLLSYLLALSNDDDHKGLEVTAALNVPWQPEDTDPQDLQIDGFEALAVTLEQPGRERLQLEVYEGPYPQVWPMLARQRRSRTEAIAVSPLIANRLAKAAKVYDDATLRLYFGGKDKPIQVTFGDEPVVTGLVMPCRWSFADDAPYGTGEPEEPAE